MSRRARRQQQNPLNIGVGDVVLVDLRLIHSSRYQTPFTVEVLDVAPEHAFNEHGRPVGDLVRYLDPEPNEFGPYSWVNVQLIPEVIRRNPHPIATNIFRQQREEFTRETINVLGRTSPPRVVTARGTMTGELTDLVAYVLGGLPFTLERPLDHRKIMSLYYRTRPGFVESPARRSITVRRQPFQAWVRRNAFQLMQSAKSVTAERTRRYRQEQDMMSDDLARELDRYDDGVSDETAAIMDTFDDSWANF